MATLIYDSIALKEIVRISCSILKNNFYYDQADLKRFIEAITESLAYDFACVEAHGDDNWLENLHTDEVSRLYFTCYMASSRIREVFIHKLNFSEQELALFEKIIPKYEKTPQ